MMETYGTCIWLVVSTPLKNITQLGSLFPIYGTINAMFQTINQVCHFPGSLISRFLPQPFYPQPSSVRVEQNQVASDIAEDIDKNMSNMCQSQKHGYIYI